MNKYRWMFFARCGVSAILSISAVILAYNKIEGWGWFLFAALLVVPSVEYFKD